MDGLLHKEASHFLKHMTTAMSFSKVGCTKPIPLQVIKTFFIREGWWYTGIKGDGGVKSKGTRLLIEKEK